MVEDNTRQDVGPLWVGRLVVILIVLVIGAAAVALYFAARGPR